VLAAVLEGGMLRTVETGWTVLETQDVPALKASFARLSRDGVETWWRVRPEAEGRVRLEEGQCDVVARDGSRWINGAPESPTNTLRQVGNLESLRGDPQGASGPVGLTGFIAAFNDPRTRVRTWQDARFTDHDGSRVVVYSSVSTPGPRLLRPGLKFKVEGTPLQRLDFLSLMLALFLGTAALPHILIRYYTVPSPAAARKSTIVAIAAIGAFYVMTLYMGLGAMVNGVMNPADGNMAAPLLARSFGNAFFAVISAIAFATVLGTVSGLIVAAAGAVAHDLCDRFLGLRMDDRQKIRAGKASAFVIGAIAIVLGIAFKGMNVSFLVGLAFAVAASANLPAILMMLFWKRTTAAGITASILMGVVSSLVLIALSPDLYKQYGLDPTTAPIPFSNPGIVTIPLSFLTLVVVSLLTPRRAVAATAG
jgi:cation/acetate symporter